ncbi:MAG: helix-turn-helix domain-containing protein, partial [Clostridiales bacterium]|nr:helix-turn-helix domain-containing protein [Clostridiales bacterium]
MSASIKLARKGEVIKKLRREKGLTQDKMAKALFIGRRQLARFESGEAEPTVLQFATMMEMLGQPTGDFWLYYLESNDYKDYITYREVRRLFAEREYDELKPKLDTIEASPLYENGFIAQFIQFIHLVLDTPGGGGGGARPGGPGPPPPRRARSDPGS